MGCINVPDKHFSYVTEHVHVAHAVVGSSGGGVGRGSVLTFLTSTSLMLRNMYTLRMLSYDHQGDGVGGCINVLDGHFPYVTEQVAGVDMLHILSDALLLDF